MGADLLHKYILLIMMLTKQIMVTLCIYLLQLYIKVFHHSKQATVITCFKCDKFVNYAIKKIF